MHTYYIAGVPYSDELYHHGMKGMKWGRRLYQYEDGTLTPLGKIHYGVSNSAKATGKVIAKAGKATGKVIVKAGKAVGKYEVDKFKRNHPWLMSDKELDAVNIKAKKIEQLKTSQEVARGKTFTGKLSNTLWKGLETGVTDLTKSTAINLGKGVAERILDSDEKKQIKYLQERTSLRTAQKEDRESELQSRKDYDSYKKKYKEYKDEKRKEKIETKKSRKEKTSSSKAASSAKAKKGEKFVDSSDSTRTSSSKAASSAKAKKGEKWTKKSGIFESDYIFDSYEAYQHAKQRNVIRR